MKTFRKMLHPKPSEPAIVAAPGTSPHFGQLTELLKASEGQIVNVLLLVEVGADCDILLFAGAAGEETEVARCFAPYGELPREMEIQMPALPAGTRLSCAVAGLEPCRVRVAFTEVFDRPEPAIHKFWIRGPDQYNKKGVRTGRGRPIVLVAWRWADETCIEYARATCNPTPSKKTGKPDEFSRKRANEEATYALLYGDPSPLSQSKRRRHTVAYGLESDPVSAIVRQIAKHGRRGTVYQEAAAAWLERRKNGEDDS